METMLRMMPNCWVPFKQLQEEQTPVSLAARMGARTVGESASPLACLSVMSPASINVGMKPASRDTDREKVSLETWRKGAIMRLMALFFFACR
jgi:hypothetical protein